jgi:transglutaminase-like putative cysteine protease
MRAQVWKALGERPVWDAAQRAFAGAQGTDPESRVAALAAWVRDRFLYTPDPLGLELLTDPTTHAQAVLRRGLTFGDCDDAAAFVAALGKAGGIPAKLVAVAYRPTAPLSHVYATLRTPRGWAIVDPTIPPQGFTPTPRRRLEVSV